MQVVISGGGWSGCAAAYAVVKAGGRATLIEKTDMLLGTGLVGGIMRNNGRFTALEELSLLGGKEFVDLIESVVRHRGINFPGHKHASLYDVTKIEPVIRRKLKEIDVDIKLKNLVTGVEMNADNNQIISSVITKAGDKISGDVFIDCSGTAGPMKNCVKYGQGCAMCILRCPSFGPRVSITEKAGIKEISAGMENNDFEAMSGSCKIDKNSLAPNLVKELNKKGILVIPLPEHLQKKDIISKKACQQYALQEYIHNLIILDTGHAKLMTSFFPLENLRTLKGFKDARYADPYSGGQGNSIRFMAIAPCDTTMKVKGIDNLFCAGEKSGPLVGHTEAIVTGMLAGHNAVRKALGMPMLVIPEELAIGDLIAYMLENIKDKEGLKKKYTFSGSVYFQRMQDKKLYIINRSVIREKVRLIGLEGVFSNPLF